jgi:hypothetical protein
MVVDFLLEPDVYQGLCIEPLSPGDLRHVLQYFMEDTDFVHAALQVDVKVHGYHVLFIIGRVVSVPEFAGLFQAVEVVWQRIYLSLTFSHAFAIGCIEPEIGILTSSDESPTTTSAIMKWLAFACNESSARTYQPRQPETKKGSTTSMLILILRGWRAKSYFLPLWLGRRHQFADCIEYYFELPIVFLFQMVELVCEFDI